MVVGCWLFFSEGTCTESLGCSFTFHNTFSMGPTELYGDWFEWSASPVVGDGAKKVLP